MKLASERAEARLNEWLSARTPVDFRQMELEVASLGRQVSDEIVEAVLQEVISDEAFRAQCRAAARAGAPTKLRSGGPRTVPVTLLSGRKVKVRVDYLRPDLRGRPGPRRGSGRRGKAGAGVYPVLSALGIHFGVTPALAGEVVRQVADSDSLRAGRAALARRGIDLEYKQTLRVLNAFGKRAVEQRDEWLLAALEGEPREVGPLAGQRVVIATDGGRLRERVTKPGRRRAETGHHRFDAPWKEPKLFTIYLIDADGRVSKSFRPIYDGTMNDADVACSMLVGYLKALGARSAKSLIILGDGAKWIWGRTGQIVEELQIPTERVIEIIDWYHAVERLAEISDLPARWSNEQSRAWLKRAKDALFEGDIENLMGLFDQIAVGRRARAVNDHRDYFLRNVERIQYKSFKAKKVPLGSGAVESAIRMIVNMRLKGTGTFWLRENAESMLLLRSYLKADRFDDLVDWSITKAAPWWNGESAKVVEAPLSEIA